MYITTDRGTQFECQLLAHFFRTLGFCRLRTNSFHPYRNGKVERFHRTLTAAVMSSKTDWIAALPVVFFRNEIKTGQQFHYIASSHIRTWCTIHDNSCKKDSTNCSCLSQNTSRKISVNIQHKRP